MNIQQNETIFKSIISNLGNSFMIIRTCLSLKLLFSQFLLIIYPCIIYDQLYINLNTMYNKDKPYFQYKPNFISPNQTQQYYKNTIRENQRNLIKQYELQNNSNQQKNRQVNRSGILQFEQRSFRNNVGSQDKFLSPKQGYQNKKIPNFIPKSYQSISSSPNKFNFQEMSNQFSKKNNEQPNYEFRKSGNLQRSQGLYLPQKTDRMPRNSEVDHENNPNVTQSQIKKKTILKYDLIEDFKNYKKKMNIIKPQSLKQTSSTLATVTNSNKKSQQYLFKPQTQKIIKPQNIFQNLSNKVNKIKLEDFKLIKQIGKGKFGNVFMVKHKYTGFISALKIIKKKQIIEQKLVNQLVRELKIHAYLNHPNIINFYGNFQDKENIYILLQLGCQGQLYTKLKRREKYSQEATSFIIKNLLEAVKYMHSKKLIHRDIKPENIVVVHGIVKLCDFGWAVYRGKQLRTTFCGTPLYVSPELLKGQSYDEKVDLWSVGILTYQLLIGQIPFQINNEQELSKIINEDIVFPKNLELSNQCKNFILKILNKNPKQRGLAEQLLKHSFIQKYSEFETCQQLCA